MSERKYRPVLTDDDLSLINTALTESIESFLDAATEDPTVAAEALEYRVDANILIGRFERLMEREDSTVDEEVVPGQMTIEDFGVSVPDPLTDDFAE